MTVSIARLFEAFKGTMTRICVAIMFLGHDRALTLASSVSPLRNTKQKEHNIHIIY